MKVSDVYLISGLGADSRAFNNLVFNNDVNVHHLSWIDPLPRETISEYAKRLAEKIDHTNPFAIIGLSFGGMIASEMNMFLKPAKVILLSSVNNYNELPQIYKAGGRFRIHKILPSKPVAGSGMLLSFLFGVNSKKDKELLKEVIANTNAVFSRWAIHAIVTWSKKDVEDNVIRIHGNNDKVLPVTSFKPQHIIDGGGHLMVINRSDEVSRIINDILKRD